MRCHDKSGTLVGVANDPSYGDRRRTIRISDELWQAALATAAERKESVPDVVRRALARYVRQHQKPKEGQP
jgi:hypothetical protein